MKQEKEVWLRGETVAGIVPLLQPVAHALLQAKEELEVLLAGLQPAALWKRPAGVAAPGFHLLHICGVLDRLLTYAEGRALSPAQLEYLNQEVAAQDRSLDDLRRQCMQQIQTTLDRLQHFTSDDLSQPRTVGRAALPSSVMGLCTHAAEHTMRHVGQLLVTVKVLDHQ